MHSRDANDPPGVIGSGALLESHSLIEEGHDQGRLDLLGHGGEADNIHEKDRDVLVGPGKGAIVLRDSGQVAH